MADSEGPARHQQAAVRLGAPSERSSVVERLLTAALEAATLHGLARLSMADVAKRAGLSRQTLYRHFPSRDALIAAVVAAETAKLADEVLAVSGPVEDPERSLAAGLAAALRVVRDHPLLDRLLTTEPEALLPLLTTDGGPVLGQVRAVVEGIVAAHTPELSADPVGLRRFADVVTRLLVSYAVSAPDDPPEVVAGYVSMFLIRGALGAHRRLPEVQP